MKEHTIAVFGKPNTGKTKKIIFKEVEERIKNNENLFIFDQKEEYYNNFAKELLDNNYNVKVINLKEPLKSNGWDPLSYPHYLYLNNRMDDCINCLTKIGEELFSDEDTRSDPYWQITSTNYFIALCLILFKSANKTNDEINFGSICTMINDSDKVLNEENIMKTYLKNIDSLDPIYISASPTVFAPSETKGSILSVLKQTLNLYFLRSGLIKSFINDYTHIEKIKDNEKNAIIIVGNSDINKLANVFIQELFLEVEKEKIPFTFILDNMDDLPVVKNTKTFISYADHNALTLIAASNNLEELHSRYRRAAFRNIERQIQTEKENIEEIKINTYPYPELKINSEKTFFNLYEFIKKNYN